MKLDVKEIDDEEEEEGPYNFECNDDEEHKKGPGFIAIIAQYESPYWNVLEFTGEGSSLVEWSESKDIEEVLPIGYWKWHEGEHLKNALQAEYPLIDGMMVFAKAVVEYSETHGPDGTEYDMSWDIESLIVTYPNGEQSKIDNAIRVAEDFIAAGGLCPKCRSKLKGFTYPAKKYGLCDKCAQHDFEFEIATINDPLHPKRIEALIYVNQAYEQAHWDVAGARAKKEVAEATTVEQIEEVIKEARKKIASDRAFWRQFD